MVNGNLELTLAYLASTMAREIIILGSKLYNCSYTANHSTHGCRKASPSPLIIREFEIPIYMVW